jgi:hypothetical protein
MAWCVPYVADTVFALQENEGTYSQLVKDLVADKGKRLLVNINDLRRRNPVRAARSVCFASFEMQFAVLCHVVPLSQRHVMSCPHVVYEGWLRI